MVCRCGCTCGVVLPEVQRETRGGDLSEREHDGQIRYLATDLAVRRMPGYPLTESVVVERQQTAAGDL